MPKKRILEHLRNRTMGIRPILLPTLVLFLAGCHTHLVVELRPHAAECPWYELQASLQEKRGYCDPEEGCLREKKAYFDESVMLVPDVGERISLQDATSGRVAIRDLPAGAYTEFQIKKGFSIHPQRIKVRAPNRPTRRDGTFLLTRGSRSVTVGCQGATLQRTPGFERPMIVSFSRSDCLVGLSDDEGNPGPEFILDSDDDRIKVTSRSTRCQLSIQVNF